MKKTSRFGRYLSLCFVVLLLSAGCSHKAPIVNIPSGPYPMGAVSAGQLRAVQNAIVQAGADLGWMMVVEGRGQIVGTLNIRTHQAVVDILFDAGGYSITYRSSNNLKYDGARIHKNYNAWVQELDNHIRVRLAAMRTASGSADKGY